MSDAKCPNCGNDLPSELGQHAVTPISGLVMCPHCGAEVHMSPTESGGGGESPASSESGTSESGGSEGHNESFAGHETIEGLKGELKDKQPND